MAAIEPYGADANSNPSLIDRLLPKGANGQDRLARLKDAARVPAERAVETVKSHPRAFIFGAAAVAMTAVGVALLMNRRTRDAGMKLAHDAWSRAKAMRPS